MPKSDVGLLS